MALQKKVLVTLVATIICLIVILFAIAQFFILSSFVELEEQNTRQDVEQLVNLLSDEVSRLDATALDWAAWDDTYAFVEGANEDYVNSNLVDETFTSSRLNLMLFVNTSGEIVFDKAFDLRNEEEIPVPQSFFEYLAENPILVEHSSTKSGVTGIVPLPEGSLLIASRPILTSEAEGPIRGTLIMGRYLDTTEIGSRTAMTQLTLSVHQLGDPDLPSDLQVAESYLSESAPIFIQQRDADSIAGYALLRDIYGRPALALKADMPRDIVKQGRTTVGYFILASLGIGLVVSVVILLFLDMLVLSPLSRLSENVSSIGRSGDPSKRVELTGKDEIASLASTINGTLASVEQSQRALLESEERYHSIFETAANLITSVDKEGIIVDCNSRIQEVLGYTQEEVIGQSMAKIIHPEYLAKAQESLREIFATGSSYDQEYKMARKDGTTINVRINSAGLKDEKGEYIRTICIIEDITERKQAEKRQSQLITELDSANKDLKDFAYVVSHDLKAPLRGIHTLTEWLATDYSETLDETGKEQLGLLGDRVMKMQALIDGILQYSRVGRVKEEKEEVNLNSLVSEVVDMIDPPENIAIEVADQLPTVYCEKTRMEQVFQNLLSNAVRYMGKPAGKVTIGCTEDEDGYWKFSVADNGPGIEEKHYERIFQIFQTLRPRDEVESTGVGLSIVKKIVEMQGGKIWVESKAGEGSAFFFTVPKVTA